MLKNIIISLLIPSLLYAQEPKSIPIEPVYVIDGFILSLYMQNELECENIYTEEIPLFMKLNPQIKDPDIIKAGQTVRMRICNYFKKEAERRQVSEVYQDTGLGELSKDLSPINEEVKSNNYYEKHLSIFFAINDFYNSSNDYKTFLSIPGIRYDGTYHFNQNIALGADINLSRAEIFSNFYLQLEKNNYFLKPYLGYKIGFLNQADKDYGYNLLGLGKKWIFEESSYLTTEFIFNFQKDETNVGINLQRDILIFHYYLRYLVMKEYNDLKNREENRIFQIGVGINY